ARALLVRKSKADVGACLVALALVLAERSQAVIGDAALRCATALALVAGHRVQALHVAIAAGQDDLRHVEDGRLAGAVLAEHDGMPRDLDILDIEQMPVDHRDVMKLHHSSAPLGTARPTSCERT